MLSDSDEEDSDDIAPPPFKEAAHPEEDARKPEENEANLAKSEATEKPSKPREEKVVSRIARLWREHLRNREGSETTDRLAWSKEYRSWVTEIQFELKPGEVLPSFTDLWVELNKPSRTSAPKGRKKFERRRSERPEWRDRRRHRDGWKKREDCDDKHKEARIVLEPRGERLALKPAPREDALADFAAEGSITYRRERNAQRRQSRRPRTPERPPRHKPHLEPASRYDRSKSLRLFDTSLQDLCRKGLEPPFDASVILTEMQRRSNFRIYDTPFQDFSDLLDVAAREGLVKVSARGRDRLTWVKYRARSLRRDEDRPEQHRGRRRPRSRSRSRVEMREARRGRADARDRERRSHRRPGREDLAREKRREAALRTAQAKARPKAMSDCMARGDATVAAVAEAKAAPHQVLEGPKVKAKELPQPVQAKRQKVVCEEDKQNLQAKAEGGPEEESSSSSSAYSYYSEEESSSDEESEESESKPKEGI